MVKGFRIRLGEGRDVGFKVPVAQLLGSWMYMDMMESLVQVLLSVHGVTQYIVGTYTYTYTHM